MKTYNVKSSQFKARVATPAPGELNSCSSVPALHHHTWKFQAILNTMVITCGSNVFDPARLLDLQEQGWLP